MQDVELAILAANYISFDPVQCYPGHIDAAAEYIRIAQS